MVDPRDRFLCLPDPDDLVLVRLAELRHQGELARPLIFKEGRRYHIVIVRADGTIEEPGRPR